MWKQWHDKANDDSETRTWLDAHTKPCPRCSKPVEKAGGCNLVVCKCGQVCCVGSCVLCGQPACSRAHCSLNVRHYAHKPHMPTGTGTAGLPVNTAQPACCAAIKPTAAAAALLLLLWLPPLHAALLLAVRLCHRREAHLE
jgi:hypothetical protein